MATDQLDAVDSSIKQACPDSMNIEKLLSSLELDGIPVRQRVTLTQQNQSLRVTVDSDAWQSAGIDAESAGSIDSYYYRQHGIVLLNLNSHEPDES